MFYMKDFFKILLIRLHAMRDSGLSQTKTQNADLQLISAIAAMKSMSAFSPKFVATIPVDWRKEDYVKYRKMVCHVFLVDRELSFGLSPIRDIVFYVAAYPEYGEDHDVELHYFHGGTFATPYTKGQIPEAIQLCGEFEPAVVYFKKLLFFYNRFKVKHTETIYNAGVR